MFPPKGPPEIRHTPTRRSLRAKTDLTEHTISYSESRQIIPFDQNQHNRKGFPAYSEVTSRKTHAFSNGSEGGIKSCAVAYSSRLCLSGTRKQNWVPHLARQGRVRPQPHLRRGAPFKPEVGLSGVTTVTGLYCTVNGPRLAQFDFFPAQINY